LPCWPGSPQVIYAYLGPQVLPGDFEPPLREMTEPVDLDLD
jgi:hypothetical protein